MTAHIITLTAGLEAPIDDQAARDVAARWAANTSLDLGMTSTSRDEGWLRVAALAGEGRHLGPGFTSMVTEQLARALAAAGHQITVWHAVEVLTDQENTRRAQHRGLPPLADAQAVADLCGVARQRVYQWESDRRAGKRHDFPAPALDGYWLRTEAEHFAATRKRTPGPARAAQ